MTRKIITVFLLSLLSVGTAPILAQGQSAPPRQQTLEDKNNAPKLPAEATAKPDSQEVISLKAQIQALKEQLQASRIEAAQCDVAWADTRARLASLSLSSLAAANQTSRASVDDVAIRSGYVIDWHLDPNTGRPTGEPPTVTKKPEVKKDDVKKKEGGQ